MGEVEYRLCDIHWSFPTGSSVLREEMLLFWLRDMKNMIFKSKHALANPEKSTYL